MLSIPSPILLCRHGNVLFAKQTSRTRNPTRLSIVLQNRQKKNSISIKFILGLGVVDMTDKKQALLVEDQREQYMSIHVNTCQYMSIHVLRSDIQRNKHHALLAVFLTINIKKKPGRLQKQNSTRSQSVRVIRYQLLLPPTNLGMRPSHLKVDVNLLLVGLGFLHK